MRATRPLSGPSPQLVSRQLRKSTGSPREPCSNASDGMSSLTIAPTSLP